MKINKLVLLSIFVTFSTINSAYSKSFCTSVDVGCRKYNSKIDSPNKKKLIGKLVRDAMPEQQSSQNMAGLSGLGSLVRLAADIPQALGFTPTLSPMQSHGLDAVQISMEFPASRDEQLNNTKAVEHHSKMKISKNPNALLKAGQSALKAGNYGKAKKWLGELLEIREAEGKESIELADALHEMGNLYLSLGQYDKAAPLFLRALSLKEKKLSTEHPSGAKTKAKLGDLYKAKGAFSKAENFYLQALAIYEKHSGLEETTVADIRLDLGDIYLARADYVKAERLYNRAVAISQKIRGVNHPVIARLDAKLAEVFTAKGDLMKAEKFYGKSVAIIKHSLGENHASYARAVKKLADFYKENGHYRNAKRSYTKAITVASRAFGAKHPFVAELSKSLSEVYEQLGDYTEAEEMKKKAIKAYQ